MRWFGSMQSAYSMNQNAFMRKMVRCD